MPGEKFDRVITLRLRRLDSEGREVSQNGQPVFDDTPGVWANIQEVSTTNAPDGSVLALTRTVRFLIRWRLDVLQLVPANVRVVGDYGVVHQAEAVNVVGRLRYVEILAYSISFVDP